MTDPYATLLAAMVSAKPGDSWSVDHWRVEADLAGLLGSEKVRAQQQAARDGYLIILGEDRPGVGFCHFAAASTSPAAKGRPVQVYERSAKALPGQVVRDEIPGQVDLLDLVEAGGS